MGTLGAESRFAHLLEPIRDLAENWSIDIASELEEYLSELESITISFEDGKQLDFAEAALLIQGSACVYSKKVEHLYTLVYNTLNQVVEKKRVAREASSQGEDGGAVDDDDQALDDDEEEEAFLTLDDAIREVDNISLPVLTANTAGAGTRQFTLSSAPLSLMSGETDRNDEGGVECKMHACTLHSSGSLLLPHLHIPAHVVAGLPSPSRGVPTASASSGADGAISAAAGAGAWDDDDDGNDNTYDDGGWEDALDMEPPPSTVGQAGTDNAAAMELAAEASLATATTGDMPPSSPAPLSPSTRDRAGARDAPGGGVAAAAAAFDPWKPLDPHDPTGAARRPFRRGKTYSAPMVAPGASLGESWVAMGEDSYEEAEEATGTGKENSSAQQGDMDGGVAPSDLLCRLGLLPAPSSCGSPTSVIAALRAPLWTQFEALHSAAAKRRQATRKMQRQQAALRSHVPSTDVDAAEVEVDALVASSSEVGGGGGDGGGLHEFEYMEDGPAGFDNDDDDVGQLPPLMAESAFLDADEAGTQPTQYAGAGSGARAAVLSYEELCRRHVEACLEASSSYHEDMELHRRVSEWQSKVEPYLREESRRVPFDIFTYADRLLGSFDDDSDEHAVAKSKQARRSESGQGATTSLPFAEAAQASSSYEVCRMFLAALQLTNAGNVELQTSGSLEKDDLCLTVNLLERQRKKLEIDE